MFSSLSINCNPIDLFRSLKRRCRSGDLVTGSILMLVMLEWQNVAVLSCLCFSPALLGDDYTVPLLNPLQDKSITNYVSSPSVQLHAIH